MVGQKYLTGSVLFALLALATTAAIKEYEIPEARDIIQDNAFTHLLPQYLNWFSATQTPKAPKPAPEEIIKPIVTWQGERPTSSYYGNDGNNYWPYFAPTPPPPVHYQQHYGPPPSFELQQPHRPHQNQHHQHHHYNDFGYYGGHGGGGGGGGGGGFPSFIIINPSNLQSLAGPPQPPLMTHASRTSSSTGSSTPLSNPSSNAHDLAAPPHGDALATAELASITNILGNVDDMRNEDADTIMELDAKPALTDLTKAFTDNLDLAALDLTPGELEALRKNARTLTPKRLVALLTQDSRRKRVEEAMAGIYLRNFNLNKK